MSRAGDAVVLSGLGFVVEEPRCRQWSGLRGEVTAVGLGRVAADFEPDACVSGRDRKLLANEDLLALQAARRALDDAFEGSIPSDRRWACVTFTSSKLTRGFETALPFIHLRKADHSIDTLALQDGIAAGEIEINPLDLLRTLDNNVCWWICKTYGFGDVNLQLGQTISPDFWALVAALDLVAHGDYDSVLVGGGETRAQRAVRSCARVGEAVPEDDPRLGGAAFFFVLQRAELPSIRPGYARLWLAPEKLSTSSAREGAPPMLATAHELFRTSIGLVDAAAGEAARDERRTGNDAIRVERIVR